MTLKELLDALLDRSTYGIHLNDEVVIDNGEFTYRIDGIDRGTGPHGEDTIVIEVTTEEI